MKYLPSFTLLIAAISMFVGACVQPPEYPNEPAIDFVNFSNVIMQQNVDSTRLTISFTDGDGDLGLRDTENGINMYMTDTRTGFVENFRVPFIPDQGVGNGISGEITVLILPTCCNTNTPCLPTPDTPEDQLVYKIQIEDRAGNLSNELTLPALTLLCD